MACAEVLHLPAFEGNEIAAESHIGRGQTHPDAGRLKRSTARIVEPGVIAEDRKVGHITPRSKRSGDSLHLAQDSVLSDKIHVRSVGSFQDGLVLELGDRIITHPVSQQNKILALVYFFGSFYHV